jgi:hypothetical protein
VRVGSIQFSRIENTKLVREGQVAILADDDPRCDDLARSPYFEEITEDVPDDDFDSSATPANVVDEESTKKRRSKVPVESEVCGDTVS